MDGRRTRRRERFEHRIPWSPYIDGKGRLCWKTDIYPMCIIRQSTTRGDIRYQLVEGRRRLAFASCMTLKRAFAIAANHIRTLR